MGGRCSPRGTPLPSPFTQPANRGGRAQSRIGRTTVVRIETAAWKVKAKDGQHAQAHSLNPPQNQGQYGMIPLVLVRISSILEKNQRGLIPQRKP